MAMFWRNLTSELHFFSNKFILFILYYGTFLLFSIYQMSSAKDLLMNDQTCPALLNGNKEDKIFFINKNLKIMSIPLVDVVKSRDPNLQEDVPCTFLESNLGRVNGLLKVEVRAAQYSQKEWNFTNSMDCRNFIKFRISDKTTTNLTQLCKMYKIFNPPHDHENNHTNPHTPSMWSTGNKMGFSLPIPEIFLKEQPVVGYFTVVYKVYYSLTDCVINVQQYSLNPSARICNSSSMKHQVCGSYSCSEQHRILKKLGFFPYDVVVDMDNFIGHYFSDKNNMKKYDYELMKSYDMDRRPRNYHAALFSGMTRAISFLFILSVLISCISYQLKPYLQAPSSAFDTDFVPDRVSDRPRRCYRNTVAHPFSRRSNEEIPMEHSNSTSRNNRPRRYFHHGNQRTAPSSTTNLPSYATNPVMDFPPPYDTVSEQHTQLYHYPAPPPYEIASDRTHPTHPNNETAQIIISSDHPPTNNNTNNNINNNNSSNNPTNK